MQRSNKPRFKKTGGGPLTLRGGKVVRSGETFRAHERDIPQAFRDVVQRVDPKPPHEEEAAPPQTNLEIRHKGGGWYDLVNKQTGEAVNSVSMRHDEANQFADMTVEQAVEQLQEADAAQDDEDGENEEYNPEDEGDE